MDGIDAFLDAQARRSQLRDEPECARLQHEAGYENHRHQRLVKAMAA
jgi:hypothetical protein